ncbi:MAG TPA: hypothetical protein VHE14_04145 [Solirubrobacteraceae bacterium]|nr:hypothetical protein [Solirubrobacteraceae bacterium]
MPTSLRSAKRSAALIPGGPALAVACLLLLGAGVAGCDSGSKKAAQSPPARISEKQVVRQIATAANVRPGDFPPATGATLQQLANTTSPGLQLGLASASLTPGRSRIAFGLIDPKGQFVYAPSVVYIAASPGVRARGPFPAPLDSMLVAPPFRSRNAAADPATTAAVYATHVPLGDPGHYAMLVITRGPSGLLGSTAQVDVAARSPIPQVGAVAPAVATDTAASVGGNVAKLTTRIPADDMNKVSFSSVVGKRPVVLLFSTPALCQSRVCGPVTDVALSLERQYGGKVTFIHQEVYRDNQVKLGLRPPLQAFHLQTEPWLFTVDRHGRIAARLEGAFGVNEFRQAIEAALGR